MEKPIRLLLIDDDEDEYFILEEMISRTPLEWMRTSLNLSWIADYHTAIARLTECECDLILVDYRLGSGRENGLDFLRAAVKLGIKVPVILLTGQGDYDIDMAAMQLGASDYLVKGELTPMLLERSIRYALERQQHEEELRRSEMALRKAQQVARMGSWTWFPAEDRVVLSEEMCNLFRLEQGRAAENMSSLEEIMTQSLHADDRGQMTDALRGVLEGGRPYRFESRLVWPDGIQREIWSEGVEQILGNDGKPVMMTGIVQDITERNKLDRALIQAEKMAGLGTLAAGMAHEINTPLQVITGASEVIQNKLRAGGVLNPSDIERQIAHISNNGWRIATIVRSLLDYARSANEDSSLCSLNDIVLSTLPLTARQFLNWSNITITTRLEEDLPLVMCDPNRILQVLVNLLTNSRDAMPQGGEILIETDVDEENDMVTLRVCDTGTGIPASIQNRIFDPFFTSKPPGKGIGLGLSI
ncbi:MAG: ATP-binding protein, partial [Anaerolineaceae bacterium]